MPFEVLAQHAVDFWLCGEDLPLPDNRVTLDGDGSIHLALDEKNNIEGLKRLRHKLKGMLGDLGHARAPPAAPQHLPAQGHADRCHRAPGRAPSGSAPTRASSALDVNCKAHELDNLYVVDTSFFPSIGAVNPSLTAIANALRVGDHIARAARAEPTTDRTTDRRHGNGNRTAWTRW